MASPSLCLPIIFLAVVQLAASCIRRAFSAFCHVFAILADEVRLCSNAQIWDQFSSTHETSCSFCDDVSMDESQDGLSATSELAGLLLRIGSPMNTSY